MPRLSCQNNFGNHKVCMATYDQRQQFQGEALSAACFSHHPQTIHLTPLGRRTRPKRFGFLPTDISASWPLALAVVVWSIIFFSFFFRLPSIGFHFPFSWLQFASVGVHFPFIFLSLGFGQLSFSLRLAAVGFDWLRLAFIFPSPSFWMASVGFHFPFG